MPIQIAMDHDRIATFCEKWKVREFALFGSVLRDNFGPDSDVDVVVTLEESSGLSLRDWVKMIDELKEVFGREVDLVSSRGLRNPFRRHHILTTRQILYAA